MWSGPHENNYKKRRDGQHDVTDGGTIKDALKCLSFCSVLLGIYSSLHISHLWYTASHVSHVYMGPTQAHTGYIYCTTRNPSNPALTPQAHLSFWLHCHYKKKKKMSANLFQSAEKSGGSRLCVCRDIEKWILYVQTLTRMLCFLDSNIKHLS